MRKIVSFWKILLLDTLGVIFMVGALFLGWLPGPGGIPLFIIGLSLLAINHEWAERHKVRLREFAEQIGDYIFVDKPLFQLAYDVLGGLLLGGGLGLLIHYHTGWKITLSISLMGAGLTLLLGNRQRWAHFKKSLNRKHK
jgi:hypothetical protein